MYSRVSELSKNVRKKCKKYLPRWQRESNFHLVKGYFQLKHLNEHLLKSEKFFFHSMEQLYEKLGHYSLRNGANLIFLACLGKAPKVC